jgi:hypothetical protein
MNFFGTRVESGVIQGRVFITSEEPPHGPRMFAVRVANDDGSIDTLDTAPERDWPTDAVFRDGKWFKTLRGARLAANAISEATA